ncbi:hypothetical protein [Campylobacter sp. W0066.1]|uniref:hypothetical protein n=1 Tax=Campylobacter sp. W0066.1 TaxID=2735751 RepID=UPI00301D0E3A|nr:hypothetical protein [Campylobacter sp. W0066.1]
MVLEDSLAEELCNFKNKKECNIKIIERILYYYKQYVLLRKEYMRRYYDSETLKSILGQKTSLEYSDDLECLSKNTIYKIILSEKQYNFPYVNIFEDKIENNLTASFIKNEDRKRAKEHLKALFLNANHLFVYDKFINNNQKRFIEFAKECFPRKKLNIFYPIENGMKFPKILRTNLENIHKEWNIVENKDCVINRKYNCLHDRYIIVDKKIQIILTSGIDNLMKKKKDFTYIIREL